MSVRSEFAQWRDELNPTPKPTIAERLKAWRKVPEPDPEPEPDVYAWVDPRPLFNR